MKIIYHKSFQKDFRKLNAKDVEKTLEILAKFELNPHDPTLKNHPLTGDKKNLHSISVRGDLRILFREEGDYIIVIFMRVGSHNQVYK